MRRFPRAIIGLLTLATFLFPTCRAGAQDLAKQAVPMRWLEPLLPEDLPPLELPAYIEQDPPSKAMAESFAGRYKKSLMTLRGAKGGDAIQIALVRAASLAAMGKTDEALKVTAAPGIADDAKVQVLRARILGDAGRLDEAVALLKGHLDKHPESIGGHYCLGHYYEQAGDLAAARAAFAWFEPMVDKWQGSSGRAFESAQDVTLIGRGVDRWAALNGLYQSRPALHNIILGMFLKAYDQIDRGYWPAHVAAAEYFLSHDNPKEAMGEMKRADAGNPRDPAMLRLLGWMLIEQANFDAADQVIATLREVDAGSFAADVLECRSWLKQRQPKPAQQVIEKALARQPKSIEALGLLASCHALQLRDEQARAVLQRVDAFAPQSPLAYQEVAEQLAMMRQYPRSEAMYQVAIDRAPWWTTARNGLGELYTQSGEEDKAYAALEAAHALDPFNHTSTNYLRLLDDLRKFARSETAHFVIMYDSVQDPMIPEYFGDYLETVYKSICDEYKFEPKVKTYIEVFPTHDAFSVRVAGSPWITATGASTGRIIALVAPRKGHNTQGPFNWALVLRHEFTHTVTLGATDNRIAHWMTEGLATVEEHSPLRWSWVPMLYHAVTKKELFTLDKLTFAFWRPKRPMDRMLAYAESYWVCQYIEDHWGHEKILTMLKMFRDGRGQDEVFPAVLGKSIPQFERDFFAWTEQQVATWGYDESSTKQYDALRQEGEDLIKARKYKDAVETWQEIATMRPMDALPHTRLAGLYLTKEVNQPQKAIEQLLALHKVEVHDNRYAKRVARIYRDMNRLDDAVKYALESVYIDPYDMDAHELLAELYEKTHNEQGLSRERRVMPVLADWLEKDRKKSELPKSTAQ